MTEEQGGRRAKRRCARKYTSTAMPSAVHYVGYVEDDETPEMIMAKFVELERIQAAADAARTAKAAAAATDAQQQQEQQQQPGQQQQQPEQQQQQPEHQQQPGQQQGSAPSPAGPGAQQQEADEGGLTEEQLLEVFKQTSMFNVRTALQDNDILMGIDEILEHTSERYADDEAVSDGEDMLRTFWSDEEGDLPLSDDEDEEGRRARNRRRRGGGGMSRQGSGVRLQRTAACVRAHHNIITAYNPATQALLRRRVRGGDSREEIVQLRVPPPPIPVSWGRTVAPYVPPHLRGQRQMAVPVPPALLKTIQDGTRPGLDAAAMQRCTYREERAAQDADWAQLLPSSGSSSSGGGFLAVLVNPGWECEGRGDAAVQRLARVPLRRLVPRGFVFVFVEKQHVQALCRLMRTWGYCYIENLTWVYLRPSHRVLELPGRYANRSHLTLYMFRREGEGKDIELRHQRNPDVTFDCLPAEDAGRKVPEEVFVAIETLLPTAKGRFLELWAPRGVHRPGWTHVVEAAADAAPAAAAAAAGAAGAVAAAAGAAAGTSGCQITPHSGG
ncbi:hypothetical protein ABPG75_005173 [Micractinium tetrahymenae]